MLEQRLAWAITGSGHFLSESLALLAQLKNVDVFLSRAAAEIIKQYGYQAQLDAMGHKIYQDKTASSVPVELFYEGKHHPLVVAPDTYNTIAKMAYGFSDSLVTNLYAQAGKTRVPSIIFACDTVPESEDFSLESVAPRDNIVKVFPRKIDLENVAKLATFEHTKIAESFSCLQEALFTRLAEVRSRVDTKNA